MVKKRNPNKHELQDEKNIEDGRFKKHLKELEEVLKTGLPVAETVEAVSDERVVNNVMRHEYKILNDAEKAFMLEIKDLGVAFAEVLHRINKYKGDGSRETSLAQTKIEEAVMWSVKSVTG